MNNPGKNLMGQSKEIKIKMERFKNFDICFSVIFNCYDQSLISGIETRQ